MRRPLASRTACCWSWWTVLQLLLILQLHLQLHLLPTSGAWTWTAPTAGSQWRRWATTTTSTKSYLGWAVRTSNDDAQSSPYEAKGRDATLSTQSTLLDDVVLERSLDVDNLLPGTTDGFYVVKECTLPFDRPFDLDGLLKQGLVPSEQVHRLEGTSHNVTVPLALMLLDPIKYPSLSRARKECRKRSILVVRQRQQPEFSDDHDKSLTATATDRTVGLVGTRVFPGDVLQWQVRLETSPSKLWGTYATARGLTRNSPLPIPLDVLYEDDHLAIIHKPAGLLVYRSSSNGRMEEYDARDPTRTTTPTSSPPTVHAALPHFLRPPTRGTSGALNRPRAVHRLDKPTSGCLVVAKTKPALVHLALQFHDRLVRKTYVAIVNGKLEPIDHCHAIEGGYKEDNGAAEGADDEDGETSAEGSSWHVIDVPLDGKRAVTRWRILQESLSLHAFDNTLTLVELRPETGRFHQLRRHLAWCCQRAIVGDKIYDGGSPQAQKLRDQGLMLCAQAIELQHPHNNNNNTCTGGIMQMESATANDDDGSGGSAFSAAPCALVSERRDDSAAVDNRDAGSAPSSSPVWLSVCVPIPPKFERLLRHEAARFDRLAAEGAPLERASSS